MSRLVKAIHPGAKQLRAVCPDFKQGRSFRREYRAGLSYKKGSELIPKVSAQDEQAGEKHAVGAQVYPKPPRGRFREPFRHIRHDIGRHEGHNKQDETYGVPHPSHIPRRLHPAEPASHFRHDAFKVLLAHDGDSGNCHDLEAEKQRAAHDRLDGCGPGCPG